MAEIKVETLTDLLTDFAEKLGETSVDTSDARKRKINSAINYISMEDLWWWDETSSTDTTTTALSYTLPTNFRVFHPNNPFKIGDNWRKIIPFSQVQRFDGSSGVVQLPQYKSKKLAYIYGTKIYLVQTSQAASETITYYFYQNPTMLDEGSDTPDMPEHFRESISLLAAGNYLKSQGGKESVEGNDLLELYDQMVQKMKVENERRRAWGVKRRARDPEEQAVFDY